MKKTILITGASSGIGKSTALLFAARGWNVAATMRSPEKDSELAKVGINLYQLDVTDSNSIKLAIEHVIKDFGQIDVIVNNAGYGAVGIFEKASDVQIRKQFDTNVFGVMNVIREILPHFRAKKSGILINITSMGGLVTFPIYSVYHGTKWAVEGFSESLSFELRPLGIKVKCIEPGAIKTDFYDRSQELFNDKNIPDYDAYEKATFANTQKVGADAPGPEIVAKTIYLAATDNSNKLRYPVGSQSPILLLLRRIIPLSIFMALVRSQVEKGFK